MKTIFPTLLTLAFAGLSAAEEVAPVASSAPCKQCNVPTGRAALMTGRNAPAAPRTTYVVTGMTSIGCSGKVSAALARIEGVTVDSVCHKSGHAIVHFDPARVKSTGLIAAINAAGFRASGELLRIRIPTMVDDSKAESVEKALGLVPGVTWIQTTVTPATGSAAVVFDPAKTDRSQLEAAVIASGSPVGKGS